MRAPARANVRVVCFGRGICAPPRVVAGLLQYVAVGSDFVAHLLVWTLNEPQQVRQCLLHVAVGLAQIWDDLADAGADHQVILDRVANGALVPNLVLLAFEKVPGANFCFDFESSCLGTVHGFKRAVEKALVYIASLT
jgi:hypothetical protein